MLTEKQILRYERHLRLDGIGREGQEKLLKSKVLVIGAGGLGSAAILYLAAMGIGTLGIADDDVVDLSNLQRQIIHSISFLGKEKIVSAKKRINDLNDDVNVQVYNFRIDEHNIGDLIKDYDFVIDATDNFESKFLINDMCYKYGVPFSHAGVAQYRGQSITVVPPYSGCLRCIFGEPPTTDANNSILGAVPGIMGTIQAIEAIKYLLNIGELLTNQMLVFDVRDMYFKKVIFDKSADCPICNKS